MFVAFGSTVLVPLLVGFDPAIALLAAGLGTLLFHGVTGGKVPIYLGSSFAFIAPIVKATELYGMPVSEYENEIAKLIVDINDPSFKVLDETDGDVYEASSELYNAMEENGRINFFWQIASTALIEQLYVISQNTDKFLTAFDDNAASNVSLRIILIQDALNRLTEYDPEIIPVAEAFDPLTVINAITVDELRDQLNDAKDQIAEARNRLIE